MPRLRRRKSSRGPPLTIAATTTTTTTTTTKTKAVMILMPEWHQTGPRGRRGYAKQTGSRHHRYPPKALWPHHTGGGGGGYPRKTRKQSARLRSTSALPKRSPPLQKMPRPTQHRRRRAGSGDGLSAWAMKRRGRRSGRVRCESPPLAPAAYGCRDYEHGQDDQLVDDARLLQHGD